MNWKKMTTAAAAACAMALGAGTASAAAWCKAKPVCSKSTDTCHGGFCVPTAKLCTNDAACKSFQKCSFSCPTVGGGSSTEPSPPKPSQDGGSSGASADAASSDAGSSGAPMPPDAASDKKVPAPADASDPPPVPDGGQTDSSGPIDPPPANCPKSPGVCVADPVKVTPQPGCEAFCKAVLACDLGGGSSSGSGGTGTDDAGSAPTPSKDAGGSSGDSAGFAPKPPADGGGSDDQAFMPDAQASDGGSPLPPDGGPGGGGDLKSCVFMCSVWKLEQVAPIELVTLEKCVATTVGQCKDMNAKCESALMAFTTKAIEDDSWMLGLGGMMGGGGTGVPEGGDGGSSSGGDTASATDATSGGADSSLGADGNAGADIATAGNTDAANPPKGSDGAATADADPISMPDGGGTDSLAAKDAAATGGAGSAAPKDDGGCTAAHSGSGDSRGMLAMLACLGAMLWLRRRQVAVA